jgi:hypothetical protein
MTQVGRSGVPSIDQFSVAAIPIEMLFNATNLGIGTAFVWVQNSKFFLITNWHNVSGKDPNIGQHISKTAAEPNKLRGWFNVKGQLGNKVAKEISIRNQNDQPIWLVHPQYGNRIDVVAIPLPTYADVETYAINSLPAMDLLVQIGMDVFILGYPFGIGPGGLPVWKRASVASEPELVSGDRLFTLVDTASRPGMSGSPVIRRSWGTHTLANGSIEMGQGQATKFVGVYSGRLATSDPLDSQLGLTWNASFVPEIVSGGKVDTSAL